MQGLTPASLLFIAAGPDIKKREIEEVLNIDIVPTILELLGVQGSDKIQGAAIPLLH
jgi:arylsulfatase A-like enzyme